MIEVLSSKQPKARLTHRCGHCARPIHRQTVYRSIVCADNGHIWRFKAHIECDDLFNAYARELALDEYDLVDWYDVLEWKKQRDPA